MVVIVAPKPAQPIDKGLPGPGLLAFVITSKYCDHLPLNRQEAIIGRLGVPNRIVIVVFPELRLYGFRPGNCPFPELLRILEDDGVPRGGATMQKRKPIVIASGSAVAIEIGSLF